MYYTLFQLVAVRLNPKLLIDNGRDVQAFLNSPIGRFREFMKPVWLNNGPIVVSLFSIGLGFTIAWIYLRKRTGANG